MDLDIGDYAYEGQTLIPKKPKQKEVLLIYFYLFFYK